MGRDSRREGRDVQRSSDGGARDPRATSKTDPVMSSGAPTTAASAQALCATSADSISAVPSRWPDTLMTSAEPVRARSHYELCIRGIPPPPGPARPEERGLDRHTPSTRPRIQ